MIVSFPSGYSVTNFGHAIRWVSTRPGLWGLADHSIISTRNSAWHIAENRETVVEREWHQMGRSKLKLVNLLVFSISVFPPKSDRYCGSKACSNYKISQMFERLVSKKPLFPNTQKSSPSMNVKCLVRSLLLTAMDCHS